MASMATSGLGLPIFSFRSQRINIGRTLSNGTRMSSDVPKAVSLATLFMSCDIIEFQFFSLEFKKMSSDIKILLHNDFLLITNINVKDLSTV